MNGDPDNWEALLTRLSDGGEVDWDLERDTIADPAQRERVNALRDVARIAEFSRSAQRAPDPDAAGTEPLRWGPYVLLERTGEGTSGEVWRAWDPQLNRELAVKMLRPDSDRLAGPGVLLAEGRALAQVHHPNVVTVHGLQEHAGRTGLLMELVRGTSLAQEIERRGALPAAEVTVMARELLAAIAAVHAAGVLHRDVKPANVVRDAGGRWVLADFGLGVRRAQAVPHAAPVSGTPLFMPPECLDGSPASERADVYAAGATAWWALTGRPPILAGSFEELRAAARRGPEASLLRARADVPAALREVLLAALAPQPAVPPASAASLLGRLAAASAPASARSPRPWAGLALAAVLAAAIAIGWWVTSRPSAPGAPPRGAPAAGAPVVAAPGAYSVEAALVRHEAAGVRTLADGDRVGPGDRLSLDFRSTSPMYVYVLNSDERGETFLLFPQPVFDQANPVAAGASVRLPGSVHGRPSGWTVTSRGGREHFLVVASPHPVPSLEHALAAVPAPRPDRRVSYARITEADLEPLRGVGGVGPLPEPDLGRPAALFDRIRTLAGREAGVRGTWVRQVTLENPAR